MGRKTKKKNRSGKGHQRRHKKLEAHTVSKVERPTQSLDESGVSQAVRADTSPPPVMDFSNWSLDTDSLSAQSSDGGQLAHKQDFSQWSLDGSVSSEAADPTPEMNQGISNWSLEPSGETLTPSTETCDASEQVPVEFEEPGDAPQLSHEDWIVQGEGAFAENQLDEAEKCFLTALLLNPISPIALSNLGVVFHTRGNLEAAELCYLKSVAFDQKSADGFYGLAQMWSDAGHPGLALRYAARGLRRQPDHDSLAEMAHALSQRLDGQLAQLHA